MMMSGSSILIQRCGQSWMFKIIMFPQTKTVLHVLNVNSAEIWYLREQLALIATLVKRIPKAPILIKI